MIIFFSPGSACEKFSLLLDWGKYITQNRDFLVITGTGRISFFLTNRGEELNIRVRGANAAPPIGKDVRGDWAEKAQWREGFSGRMPGGGHRCSAITQL